MELTEEQVAQLLADVEAGTKASCGTSCSVVQVRSRLFYDGKVQVALRRPLPEDKAGVQVTAEAFKREVDLLDALHGLEIAVKLLGVHWGEKLMVMEWWPGGNLDEWLRRGEDWSAKDRVAFVLELCEGVLQLQTHLGPGKVVEHLDIKVSLGVGHQHIITSPLAS